jgi:hypothetical protein
LRKAELDGPLLKRVLTEWKGAGGAEFFAQRFNERQGDVQPLPLGMGENGNLSFL